MRVQNFRSVQDETLVCDELTALVGANGVGKSTFLRALELFYNPTPRLSEDDYYAGDVTKELVITVTYRDLPPPAISLFGSYMQAGTLTVERVFSAGGGRVSAKYFGATLQHVAFQAIRDGLGVKDRGKTAKTAYDGLRSKDPYKTLPEWTTLGAVPEALAGWEAANPELCSRARDNGQFFGFTAVAQGYLGRYTRLLYIPAVRDAAGDAEEGRGSVLTALMDLVVRNAVATQPALLRLQRRSQLLYERALDPTKIKELVDLGQQPSGALASASW